MSPVEFRKAGLDWGNIVDTKNRANRTGRCSLTPGKRYSRQFKLSAARLALEKRGIPVKEISKRLEAPDNTIRRWASERERSGEAAFPGKGSPVVSKDYKILKLRKESEDLRKEVELLKNSGPS